jgi:hypothetical protein
MSHVDLTPSSNFDKRLDAFCAEYLVDELTVFDNSDFLKIGTKTALRFAS